MPDTSAQNMMPPEAERQEADGQTSASMHKPPAAFKRMLAAIRQSVHRRRRVPPVLQLTALECGAACLAMILGYYGRKTSVGEVRDRYGVGRDGLSARSIVKAARDYGLRVRAISLQENDFRYVNLPAIIHWEFNHFMVVERWSPSVVDVVDPAAGYRRLTTREFDEGFTGVVLMLEPGENFERHAPAPPTRVLTYALQYIKRAPGVLVQILATSLLLQLLGLTVPILTAVIVDQIVPLNMTGIIPLLGIGIIGLLLAELVITVLRSFLLIYLQNRIDLRVLPAFIEHMLTLPLNFFQQRSRGDILTRISSNLVIREIVSSQFVSVLLDGSLVIVYLVILFWQSWIFAVIVLSVAGVQVAILLCTQRALLHFSRRELEAIGKTQGYVAEMLSGMMTIKAAGAEQRAFQQWANLFSDQLNISTRRGYLLSLVDIAITMLNVGADLALLWLGTILVLNFVLPLGTMLGLNALAVTFLVPLSSLASSISQVQIVRSHLDRIADITDTPAEQDVLQAQVPPQLTGRITLEHVRFRYSQNAADVLQDINIAIEPGQKIAIVGQTGSGKSTLGKLLLGLYLPTDGEILYDDIPLRYLDYQAVRAQFGVIMQDSSIFSGSIRQNIAFNNPDVDMDRVIQAAQMAALHEDIIRMPMTYETAVAEGGNALSGGQRQRLAIARALLNTPSILLLDEATSALDVLTERIIEQNLHTLACTQIIIAHRLSTVRHADCILVLEQGRIIESGSHEKLLQIDGYYSRLIHNQLS